jgi:hypothetical protein
MLLMCSVINGTTEQKLYTHKQSEVNTQYVNCTHKILQITEIKVKQLVTKRKCSNRWQCMWNVTSFTIMLHRLTLSCLSVPLKYCGNCDGDEPLQTDSIVNVFVLPGH